jgi:YihY family inner membrane protein
MAQSGVGSTVRALIETARTEQLGFLAAAIAYYAFVSLIPLLLLALAVATTVAGEAFAARVLGVAGTVLSPAAIGLLDSALSSGAGRGGATLAGLVVLAWSGLRVFRGLDLAFARIYRTEEQSSLVTNLADAAVALAAIGAAVGAVVVATAVLPRFGIRAQSPAGALVLTAVLPVVFLPLYYVFPDCPVTLREVLPGAALAGFGWTALGVVFGIYATGAASFQLYGVIGGVLVVLTWFYFGGLLLLSGAVLNTVLAGRRDRQLQQGPLRDPYRAMHESDGSEGDGASARRTDTDATAAGDTGGGVSEPVDQEDIAQLRRDLDRFEAEIEDRTVHRDELEADLQRYVRRRQRRGHARGWGPYLVLLYGTVMSLGAFFFLDGVWAVLALLFVWLSTLGLYTLMVLVGLTFTVAGLPGRLRDAVSGFRD